MMDKDRVDPPAAADTAGVAGRGRWARRLPAPAVLAGAGAGLLLVLAAAAWLLWPAPAPQAAPLAGTGGSAATVVGLVSEDPVAAALQTAAEPAPPTGNPAIEQAVEQSAEQAVEPAADATEAPPDAEPTLGQVVLPPRPRVMPERAAPRRAAAVAQAASAAAPAPAVAAAAAASGPAVAPPAEVWAVSTGRIRTRAESEQLAQSLQRLLAAQKSALQVDLVAVGDDYRVAVWPYATRAEAERLRGELAARGLRTDVVAF